MYLQFTHATTAHVTFRKIFRKVNEMYYLYPGAENRARTGEDDTSNKSDDRKRGRGNVGERGEMRERKGRKREKGRRAERKRDFLLCVMY